MSKKAKRTETAPQKANSSLIALCAVLVVAVVLIVVLFVRSNNLNSQLDTLNTELTETNATLQQTVTDKEAVQEQLTAAEESLREAQLTLEESTKKVADLEGQLTALTDENNANKAQIAVLTADLESAKANKAAAEVYLANVEASIQMALNALNGVTPAPTAEPTPEPTPEVGQVDNLTLAINGNAASGVMEITGDTVQINWGAFGQVESYTVYVDDAGGNRLISETNTQTTSGQLPVGNLTAGQVYTVTVGARPVNGSDADIQWTTGQFIIPIPATPVPTAEPTVAPVSMPQINIDGTAYNKDGVIYLTGSTAIFNWAADGEKTGYRVYVENGSDRITIGDNASTSYTLDLSTLPAGIYSIHVGVVPAGARGDIDIVWNSLRFGIPAAATPEPTAAPTPEPVAPSWPTELSAASAPEAIQQVQMKLYQLQLLSTDGLQAGILDAPTLQAIARFQMFMNETYDMMLPVIDPANLNSIIDAETLAQLNAATLEMMG